MNTTKKRLRASAVCVAEGHLLLVRLCDPLTQEEAVYPPGGRVEPGETPPETAERETLEETGLVVSVARDTELVDTYPFRWAGDDVDVTTHYFFASLKSPFVRPIPKVVDAEYNLGASWLPVQDALAAMAKTPGIAAACARVLRSANTT